MGLSPEQIRLGAHARGLTNARPAREASEACERRQPHVAADNPSWASEACRAASHGELATTGLLSEGGSTQA